jgi:hypothetical protein
MLMVVPFTTTWRVFRLKMRETISRYRVAANIPNKQLQTAGKGRSSILRVGSGLTIHLKKQHVTKCYTGPQTLRAFVNTGMNLQVS